jgi:hypothetical protein
MASRTTETTVTFERPFLLPPIEALQPAGIYRLVVDEDEVQGLSFLAYRRTATMLSLPAIAAGGGPSHAGGPSHVGGPSQVVTIRPEDLEAALARDRAPD